MRVSLTGSWGREVLPLPPAAVWLALCPTREQAFYQAHYASQISLSEIARQLGLSVSRISRIVSVQRALRETALLDEMRLGEAKGKI